ncbi:hypothetical protein FQR65_LT10297 [Abscondita terminalis]|nr:hypothetical protein FQR65_LT10297 [Abscondita terminalis]
MILLRFFWNIDNEEMAIHSKYLHKSKKILAHNETQIKTKTNSIQQYFMPIPPTSRNAISSSLSSSSFDNGENANTSITPSISNEIETDEQFEKISISEMKTNVRRRARDVRYSTKDTGRGAAVKSLTDLEERFLALLSHLTVKGEDLPEAGVATNQDLNIKKIPIYFKDASQEV